MEKFIKISRGNDLKQYRAKDLPYEYEYLASQKPRYWHAEQEQRL